jgi:uncharacterized membrane protein (UPF0127 family)
MNMFVLINDKEYPLEVKITSKGKSQGMMGRNKLNGGMLFLFDEPKEQSFWMKNCLIPLDIIFLKQGVITKIHSNCEPCNQQDCVKYTGYGDMVLEFVGGFSDENMLKVGDKLSFK